MGHTAGGIQRIKAFDGVRGLLAWWVVLGHVLYTYGDAWGDAVGNHFAVDVFIILSGFVITYLIDAGREPYLPYIARRWFRLYPVYILLLIFAAAFQPYAYEALSGALFLDGNANQNAVLGVFSCEQHFFWPHFVLHMLLLHGAVPLAVLPQADSTFILTAWSLSLEWQYYVIAPFIVWTLGAWRRLFWLAGFILLLLLGLLVPGYKTTTGYLPIMWLYFAIGIGSYYLWKARAHEVARTALPLMALVLALNAAMLGEVGVLIWVVLFYALMDTLPMGAGRRLLAFLETPALQHMGKISYPLYLCHMPVYFAMMYLARPLRETPVVWGVWMGLTVPLGSYLVALFLHTYVERPGIKLGRRVTRRLVGLGEPS